MMFKEFRIWVFWSQNVSTEDWAVSKNLRKGNYSSLACFLCEFTRYCLADFDQSSHALSLTWYYLLHFGGEFYPGYPLNRHFSHVTKNRKSEFKKTSWLKLLWQFLEKPLQTPKIIFKSPKLIGQKSLSYEHLLKDKILKFKFLREPTF